MPPVHQIPELLRAAARLSPKGKRDEFKEMLADVQPILTYMERQPEIEAASSALEAHRAEFDRLTEDPDAFMERTQALFAEKRFEPLRFKADEVERVLEGTTPTLQMMDPDRFVEAVRGAILRLADKKRRSEMSMRLLLELPDYVAAGRHLDAWIIQHCAYLTSDQPDESNPFLFQMFSFGYDAWSADYRARGRDMLSELGIDVSRLENMSMEEMEAWMEQEQADPARKARMEAILGDHPDQRKIAEDAYEEMERNSVSLFDREDGAWLLLSQEELAPWWERLTECAKKLGPLPPATEGSEPDPALSKAFFESVWPTIEAITGAIFSAERRRQLSAQLKTYQNDLVAAGERRAADCALAARRLLEGEENPAENYFLNGLVFASVRRLSAG